MNDRGSEMGVAALSSMERVMADAERLGLGIEVRTLSQSTRTAEDAALACGCNVAQIVKSLVFVDSHRDALVLLLVSGAHQVDFAHIEADTGLLLARCDARRVRADTGFAIGGVAPIGHLTPIDIFMDRTLLAHDTVFAAAGRPDSLFAVAPDKLLRAVDATLIDVAPPTR